MHAKARGGEGSDSTPAVESNATGERTRTKVFQTDEVETHALSGVHLSVGKGDYVAISGPSGCGKSPLLSILGPLDSPTGNLDSKNGEAVMELLGDLHRGGATICMVTQDPRFARHADRTIHLFDGQIVDEEGHAETAAAAPHRGGP